MRDAQRCPRWLLAAACAMAACTLTDDAFEPTPVDRVDGELSPEASSDGSPLADDPASSATAANDSPGNAGIGAGTEGSVNEPDLGSVPLDAPDTGGGGSPGATTGDSAGPGGDARGDAGVGSDPGTSNPDVDSAPDQPPLGAPCSGSEFAGSCYQIFGELAPWIIAEQRCAAWGGHLASVQSLEEDTFLDAWPAQLAIPFADGSGIWLGGTDAPIDGDFRWSDASPLTFAGWAPNQPDNGAGIDCIEKRNDGTALWYDRRCSDTLPFVCERPL